MRLELCGQAGVVQDFCELAAFLLREQVLLQLYVLVEDASVKFELGQDARPMPRHTDTDFFQRRMCQWHYSVLCHHLGQDDQIVKTRFY